MSVTIERRLFTATEYERLAEAGILSEDDRVELIEGEIINLSPIGSRHAACVKRLNALLTQALGKSVIVSVQDPILLDDLSEPQPDIAVLRPRGDFYKTGHPTPANIMLIIEVAETSLEYDRGVKIPLYAKAMIPEVLLVGLNAETVTQYARPLNGTYQGVRTLYRGQSLTLQSIPELTLNIDDILD
jgi:Uma2 family endonuclease